MATTGIITLNYGDIFDDLETINIQELIKDIPTKTILQVAGHFSAQIHIGEKGDSRQVKLLQMWLSKLPPAHVRRIETFIKFVKTLPNSRFNFINNIANCSLAELALTNPNDLPMVDDLSAQQELNLLKTYLYCNQQWQRKQEFTGEDGSTSEGLSRMLIKLKFPYDEILMLKDFRMQFIKAIFFFKYCENNPVFKEYLKIFFEESKVDSWNEYLSNLLNLYIRKFDEQKVPSVLKIGLEHIDQLEFTKQFCLDLKGYIATPDFLGLREKPIVEIRPNEFLFLNLNFFVDKFFQGIQFALFRTLKNKKATYKGKEIKTFDQFRSIYGEEVSENGLFYSTVNYLMENSPGIKITGASMKLVLKEGEPDYYIRQERNVFLMEYKDILINAAIKHSYSYDTIRSEIFKKLVSNEKNSDKGISQLINSIEKILAGHYRVIDPFDPADGVIYPILVSTDFSFNVPGVNYMLNSEFRRRLKERGLDHASIRDLTIIDLEDLLKYQDYFRKGVITLSECLSEYQLYVSIKSDITNTVISFSHFMKFKTSLDKYVTPELLLKELKGMVPD